MNLTDIALYRLTSQHIAQPPSASAEEVVSWMGAMQAQEYQGALWSIGLRTPTLTQNDIVQAIADKKIIRTWPMRGTLHFVASSDVRWMVALLAPRATTASATRRKNLEIDGPVIAKSERIIIRALVGGTCLSRADILTLLTDNDITTSGQRGIHLLRYFSEKGLLCFGPHINKQPTFVLLDEWVAPTPPLSEDEALYTLTKRYFTSHGPATLRDFAGWGGITLIMARRGLALTGLELKSVVVNNISYWLHPNSRPAKPAAYLLPGFDEYMLGYKDRSAALPVRFSNAIIPGGNGIFLPTLVADGQIVGTWKRILKKTQQTLIITPLETLSNDMSHSIERATKQYEAYVNQSVDWQFSKV